MDLALILAALNAGVNLYTQATGKPAGQASAFISAGGAIVAEVEKLYGATKDAFSTTDQATVDAALDAAKAQTSIDVDRVEGEIAADKT